MKHSQAVARQTILPYAICFWAILTGAIVVDALVDNLFSSDAAFLVQAALCLLVPPAMAVLFVVFSRKVLRDKRWAVAGALVCLVPWLFALLVMFGPLSFSTGVDSLASYVPGQLMWTSWLIVPVLWYVATYAVWCFKYGRTDKASRSVDVKSSGLPALIAVLCIGCLVVATASMPTSSDKALKQYFSHQDRVQSYQIKDTIWTHRCCAVSSVTAPRKANGVRYIVQARYRDGHQEGLTIDFYDKRPEYQQTQLGGFGGRQDWQVSHVYHPGEALPPAVYQL